MPIDPLTIGLTAGGALVNFLSGEAERRKQRRALDRYRKALMDMKYNPVEKREDLDRISDTFNTQINQFLNESTAGIATRGFLNPQTRGAILQGKLLGEKSRAIAERSSQIDQFNKNIDLRIAQSELNIPEGNAFSDIVSGGLGGLEAGMNLSSLIKENELTDKLIENLTNEGSNTGSPYFSGINIRSQFNDKIYNPFIGKYRSRLKLKAYNPYYDG